MPARHVTGSCTKPMLPIPLRMSHTGQPCQHRPRRILDGDELCRVRLASHADESRAGIAVVAGNIGSMTDGADHSRLSHPNIFALHLQPAMSISA